MEEKKKKDLLERIEPILDDAMHKYLGITINELRDDLVAKLRKPWINYEIDTKVPFKDAKHMFKKMYLHRLLLLYFGNVSEVARVAGINRRSIHRIIADVGIDIEKIRNEMVKRYDIKQQTVNTLIEDVLDNYKQMIHPQRLESMYQNIGEVTKELLIELPEEQLPLDKAEDEFERKYLTKALEENAWNITHTAEKIGLRYETLHRKIKELGIERPN